MESHKIISVEIVRGDKLNRNWRSQMQIIVTDKGTFIDNMPGKQFGFFHDAKPGIDWSSKIDEVVHDIKIYRYSGYNWLNKQ